MHSNAQHSTAFLDVVVSVVTSTSDGAGAWDAQNIWLDGGGKELLGVHNTSEYYSSKSVRVEDRISGVVPNRIHTHTNTLREKAVGKHGSTHYKQSHEGEV